MTPPGDGAPAAGACHARGSNASLPPQWIVSIGVDDRDARVDRAVDRGAAVVSGPRKAGEEGRYCVPRDPAGAVFALDEANR